VCLAYLLDLAPHGVYKAGLVTRSAGGLLLHRFTLTDVSTGGLLSVALSVGSPSVTSGALACRLAVSERAVLWSSDFPLLRVAHQRLPGVPRPIFL
jgi:hypothetical protein